MERNDASEAAMASIETARGRVRRVSQSVYRSRHEWLTVKGSVAMTEKQKFSKNASTVVKRRAESVLKLIVVRVVVNMKTQIRIAWVPAFMLFLASLVEGPLLQHHKPKNSNTDTLFLKPNLVLAM